MASCADCLPSRSPWHHSGSGAPARRCSAAHPRSVVGSDESGRYSAGRYGGVMTGEWRASERHRRWRARPAPSGPGHALVAKGTPRPDQGLGGCRVWPARDPRASSCTRSGRHRCRNAPTFVLPAGQRRFLRDPACRPTTASHVECEGWSRRCAGEQRGGQNEMPIVCHERFPFNRGVGGRFKPMRIIGRCRYAGALWWRISARAACASGVAVEGRCSRRRAGRTCGGLQQTHNVRRRTDVS